MNLFVSPIIYRWSSISDRYVLLQKIFKLSSHGIKSVCKFETFFVFLICHFDHNISGIREWMWNKRKIQKFFWTKSIIPRRNDQKKTNNNRKEKFLGSLPYSLKSCCHQNIWVVKNIFHPVWIFFFKSSALCSLSL